MKQTYDQNAVEYWKTEIPDLIPAKQSGKDVLRGTCPECGKPKKFDVYQEMPMPGKCIACGYTVEHVFKLGYTTDGGYQKEFTPIEKIIWQWKKNNPTKAYRLTQEIVDKIGLEIRPVWSQRKNKFFDALCFIGTDDKPLKWLMTSEDGRWMSVPRRDGKGNQHRSSDFWLNLKNLDRTSKDIYICAGEPDLTAFLVNTGIHAISPVDGEGPKTDYDISDFDIFDNKRNHILYDNDKIGRAGANWLGNIIQLNQKTDYIKVVDWKEVGLTGGQDTDDYFKLGGTKDGLFKLIQNAPEFKYEKLSTGGLSTLEERPVKRPEYTDSSCEDEILDYIWKIGILPPAKRKTLWKELVRHEGYDDTDESQKESIKDRITTYNTEFHAMTTKAFDSAIEDVIINNHIKKLKKYRVMESSKYYYYADGVYKFMSEEVLQKMADEIARPLVQPDKRELLSKGRKQALDDMSNRLVHCGEYEFDNDISKINFINGIYCLQSRTLLPHTPSFLSTSQLEIAYKEDEDCPNFKEAILLWFEKDDTRKEFLKGLYYLITGDRSHDKALFFFGKGGDGKGQASQLCRALVGEHLTAGIALEDINQNHMTAGLFGMRLNISDESKSKHHMNDAMFKRLTGNSIITVNPKNRDPITFISKALWVILSNHLPSASDNSHGYDRRWKLINFRRIPEERKTLGFFEEKLRPELSGIVYYILTTGREIWESANDGKGGFTDSQSEIKSKKEMENKNSVNSYWDIVMEMHNYRIEELIESGMEKEQASLKMIPEYKNHHESMPVYCIFDVRDGKNGQWLAIDTRRHFELYQKHAENQGQNPFNESNFKSSTENFMEKQFPKLCAGGFEIRAVRDKKSQKTEKIFEVVDGIKHYNKLKGIDK